METRKQKIVQKLGKEYDDKYELAQKYYAVLSALNNLKLTEREIQLSRVRSPMQMQGMSSVLSTTLLQLLSITL